MVRMRSARMVSVISRALGRPRPHEVCVKESVQYAVRHTRPWSNRRLESGVFRCMSTRGIGGEGPASQKTGGVPVHIFRRVRDAMVSQYLPLSFITAMAAGYVWPHPGVVLADANFMKYCTFSVFVASGLLLERKEAAKALSSRGSILFGLTSILLLTPLAAPLMLSLPVKPMELALGLAVLMLTPTTLSTGVTLVQAARANVAMALLLTLLSNFMSVFIMPLSLSWLMGKITSGAVMLSPLLLLKNLTMTVLAPTLAAYSLKLSVRGGENWVRQRRNIVSNIGTISLGMIPWMQVSKASMSGVTVDPTSLAIVVSAGIAAHLAFFGANHMFARVLKLGGEEADQAMALKRAVVLMSSQKSVTIAIAVLAQLSSYLSPEAIGIACVPCVLVHLSQTVIDSFIASKWAQTQRPQISK